MIWYRGKIREPVLDGELVDILGQPFVVAPFNIKRMRATGKARAVMRDVVAGKTTVDSDEALKAYTEITAAALSANYPDITAELLDELEGLTLEELAKVTVALNRANGGGSPGEAPAPETAGATESSPKTGTER